MAIGARITSNNLSGKTATVSFTPYTGATSGTTVDLGSVTIPFNNITSHPYGHYDVYIPDFDYTYTLTIPEPSPDVQLYVYMNRMIDSDFYGVATLNFNDLTATIIDLGVNVNDWNNNYIYELTNSGFMHYFRGVGNSDDRLVIFTDSTNTEIGRYSGTTNSAGRDTLDGRWVGFEDRDNGIYTFSNGTSVFTYTWDPNTHYIDIDWDWDATAADGTFVIKKQENGSWTYNGAGESYLVNPIDGTTTLLKTWTDGTYIRHKLSPSSNFIVVETQLQDNITGNSYTNLEIYDTSGTILETVVLSGATYDNEYEQFHGTNKYTKTYYNNNDNNVAYRIISYNGNTSNLIQTSHNRTSDYQNMNMIADEIFWPTSDGRNKGGVVLMFYNNLGWNNGGQITSYCDFMYMFNNQTSFTTYSFAVDQTKIIQDWGYLSDVYRAVCDDGSGNVSLLTIMSGSTHVETLGSYNFNSINGINHNGLSGNRSIAQIWTNGSNNVTYYLINASGVVSDSTVEFGLTGTYNSGLTTRNNNAYISIQSEGNIGLYVTSGSTTFTQTDFYNNTQSSYSYAVDRLNSDIVLYSYGTLNFRVLNATGLTQSYSFPEYNDFNIVVGKDKFMFVYSDSNDGGNVKIKLYNMSGTLLNSGTTSLNTSWNNTYGVKDRFVVTGYNNGVNEITLVSATIITSLTLQDYGNEEKINDYIYNND